jgi:arylsulfatase A-like enzyme
MERGSVVARMGIGIAAGAAALALHGPARAAEAVRPPLNVVVLLADDLGWKDLACCGSPFYETPALDRLATQGMRFTQAYASANVCSPTRASLLTGKYPARLHTTNFFGGARRGALLPPEYRQSLPAEETTLAEALRAAGYRTAIAGKWHLGGKGSQPADHGFEVVMGADARPGGGPPDDPHFSTRLSTESARFIEESKEKPFFLYLPLHSVHVPLKTRPALLEKYKAKAAALPASDAPREVPVHDHKARAVQDHAVYAGMVQEMDEAVDRVLKQLDASGLADRTVVVFTSDNGGLSTAEGSPTSNLPLRAGKGWNYEGGIRVPWIVRLPGRVAAGTTCDVPVVTADLYPTLMALAGLPMPPEQKPDGVSLAPLLEGKGGIAERALFWHYPHYSNQGGRPCGALRAGDRKLLEFFEDGRLELFHLGRDAGEQEDGAKGDAAAAEALRKRLADWREAVGAQMPVKNPEPVEPFGPKGGPGKGKPKAEPAKEGG